MKLRLALFSILLVLLCSCSTKEVEIQTEKGNLKIIPLTDNSVRVKMEGKSSVPSLKELVYTEKVKTPSFKVKESADELVLTLKELVVSWNKNEESLTFLNSDGEMILSNSYRSVEESETSGFACYSVKAEFDSPEDEFLYGTGQFQDGYLNVKGLTRRLTQVNTQISIPFILSSRGYGLLWNNYGLTDFNPADNCVVLTNTDELSGSQTVNATGTAGNRRETRFFTSFVGTIDVPVSGKYALLLDVGQAMARKHYLAVDGVPVMDVNNTWLPPTSSIILDLEEGEHTLNVQGVRGDSPKVYWRQSDNTTTFSSPVATALDFTVFAGGADEVIGSYRKLSGQVPQMPDWAFGYIHCRERYDTQDELLENAREFKNREIPVDVIVQDWQWWGKYGWNAMRFDDDKYPDPQAMTSELHDMDMKLMLSVWSKVDVNSVLGKDLYSKGYYIPETDWIDFFNDQAADYYWQNFRDSLVRRYGIDAWWFDATEPENDDLAGRMVANGTIPGDFYRNVYPLMVNRKMVAGIKQERPGEHPLVLTRSAYAGMQKEGIVTWSGDVGNDFETLRRQIVGGLGQVSCGLPWWTFDAGGFFRPFTQYEDEAYQERMIRWIQVATFLPFMRVHGYMSQTEPWRYSEKTYSIFKKFIDLRYELQPYILKQARKVTDESKTLMRPLIFDFPNDYQALSQDCEYMFGDELLVCPVLKEGVTSWNVYLPENENGWDDFFTGEHYSGGIYVDVPVSLETIPVFRRK